MTIRDCVGKLILISWKNHKIQLSRPLELLWIVFSPVMLCFIAVAMRWIMEVDMRVDSVYEPIDLERSWTELMDMLAERQKIATEYGKDNNPYIPKMVIGWAPEQFNIFGETITQSMGKLHPLKAQQFNDCSHLENVMRREYLFAGICFDDSPFEMGYDFEEGSLVQKDRIHPVLNYSILIPSELRILNQGSFISANWMTNYVDDQAATVQERLDRPYCGGYVGYVREGFIKLQKVISETFLEMVSTKTIPEIQMRRFPIIGRKQDPLLLYLDRSLALLFIIGFLFPCQILIYQVVSEKHSQLRLFMINMNIGNTIHFISWYIKGVFYTLFTSLLITVICKVHWRNDYGVLTETPWHILLLIVVSYSLASNAFAMMISAFFKHPLNAVHVLTVLWIITYMPFFVLWNNPEQELRIIRYLSYALPNCVLAKVIETLVERELIFHKEWYDRGFELIFATEPMSVTKSSWVFAAAALVYCIIGLYMDMWNATEMANKGMKRSSRAGSMPDDFQNERPKSFTHQGTTIGVNSTKIYEVEPSHRRFKLKIRKLCKRFGSSDHPALNLFTWNVYENEVTILMGHNGCGKTTLLRILAGLLNPNRGSVMISTHDIETERMAASAELGVAFNDDLLLLDLSVIDHIHFVCQVRGMHERGQIVAQANFYMQAMKITHLKTRKVRHLSAPERCLFSVCCAFLGDCSIVLIDDIHSDLDKPTQSLIWALINEEKSRRTIILVTNSTALAETMADRLAIMANGELKCTGTRTFLKNMYGHGYRLTCVKGKNCNVTRLYTMLSSYMPHLAIESDIGLKVTFVLENKYEDQFTSLLDELEQNMDQLNVVSFRIRDTSMEEIFLRFGCEQNDQEGDGQTINNHSIVVEDYYAMLEDVGHKGKLTGRRLFVLHLWALLYKRWIVARRSWSLGIVDALVLTVALVCTFSATLLYGKNFKLLPLTFNLTSLHTIEAFAEIITQESKNVHGMYGFYTELLYWYDGHVHILNKDMHGKSHLLHNNEFSQNVNYRHMFGATFSEKIVTAWFNNIPLHTAAYSLNTVHNAVARTECVSLNGYNTSGKTTLLKLLVHETRATCGRIWVGGYSMARQRVQCYRRLGYCPQNDTLPGEFTPMELMYIQALLQGHYRHTAKEVSEGLIRMMGLQSCCNLPIQFCTTGQWRRLHFALAILGSPAFICVDGVPAGIDPAGKRTIFTITAFMQSRGSSFLYTSLLPLDSERLCHRTPVLYDGQLWAIGCYEELSDNYRNGYQVEVRFKRKANPSVSLSRSTWNRIGQIPMSPHKKLSSFMELKFHGATLHDEQSDSMIFHLPLESTSFSHIFLSLRKDTFELNIEDFFITRNMVIGLHVYLFDRGSRRYTPTSITK
ncbi:GL16405 [Drosophila persimilis]|uniref:GL16405 n=1 Tax=Drosophila persimilis TaxID=7234 RepID=B4GWM5_DROPE|nr:GL16405 [Drosophila persimilis]